MREKPEPILQPYMAVAWKVAKLYNSYFSAVQREYGLTANERDVLLFLHNNRDYDTAADIVKYRSISKSLVSKSVERLTRCGFLETSQAGDDRRQVHLRIAPGGAAAIQQLAQIQQQFFEMLGEGLTETERVIFHQVLQKMGNNAGRYSRQE